MSRSTRLISFMAEEGITSSKRLFFFLFPSLSSISLFDFLPLISYSFVCHVSKSLLLCTFVLAANEPGWSWLGLTRLSNRAELEV